jgi:hypothetical protein
MRILIAASLIFICIPVLVMSEVHNKAKLHEFAPDTLIEAEKFNDNFKTIENEIAVLRSSIEDELGALEEIRTKYRSFEKEIAALKKSTKDSEPLLDPQIQDLRSQIRELQNSVKEDKRNNTRVAVQAENALKNTEKLEKEIINVRSSYERSKPVGFDTTKGWIERFGRHGRAEIYVRKGDIVKVELIGSAEKSEFYYYIIETTLNAEVLSTPHQVIMNPERWRSIKTIGLFRASKSTTLKFSAEFKKGDIKTGRIKVAGLTLIATVVGSEK